MDGAGPWRQWLCGWLGLLPVLAATLGHTVWPSQPQSVRYPPRPALAFDQYVVDLRRIEPASEAQAVFVFRNRGSQKVQITDVQPSCGCLAPIVEPREIEPGGVGRLILRIQPANENPGKRQYFADVKYLDPEPRETRLVFKVELPEQGLTVRPRALMVYQNGDQPIHEQLIVADSRPSPVQVKDASADSPWIEVGVGERRMAADGTLEQAVHVVIRGDVPPGKHRGVVTIHTSDPRQDVLRVPLRIERTHPAGAVSSHAP